MDAGRVELRAITADNFDAVIALKVAEDQCDFLDSNVESIAWAYVAPECRPVVIYEDEIPVGFATFGYIPADGRCWISHLMVDESHQGRGLGSRALEQLLDRMSAESGGGRILVAVNPDNDTALRLYETFGFCDTGRRQNRELILCRPPIHEEPESEQKTDPPADG